MAVGGLDCEGGFLYQNHCKLGHPLCAVGIISLQEMCSDELARFVVMHIGFSGMALMNRSFFYAYPELATLADGPFCLNEGKANEILNVAWPDMSLCFSAKYDRQGTKC